MWFIDTMLTANTIGTWTAANKIGQQNQMLFDAMTPEEQLRVLEAQAERNKIEAERRCRRAAKCWSIVAFVVLAIYILNKVPSETTIGTWIIVLLLILDGVICHWIYEAWQHNITRNMAAWQR